LLCVCVCVCVCVVLVSDYVKFSGYRPKKVGALLTTVKKFRAP
jgi:hypothetical protein